MLNVNEFLNEPAHPAPALPSQVRSPRSDGAVAVGDARAGGNLTVILTTDHRYRGRALAVPGAYYSRAHKAYAVDNPDARAAAAAIALFPEVTVEHPELLKIREAAYGKARPKDYAAELDLKLDAELPGLKLYDWQDRDGGYIQAIMSRDKGAFVAWEPGLGKTVVTAAFIQKMEAQRTLIVARNDAKDVVWEKHLQDLLPDHDIYVLPDATQTAKRDKMVAQLAEEWERRRRAGQSGGNPSSRPMVLIVHYQAIRTIAGDKVIKHRDDTVDTIKGAGHGWDALGDWDLMVYDESHRLASYNPNSVKNTQEGKALSYLRRKHVQVALALSGSGVMNKPDDMFGQLHYLYPHIYSAKWADWNDRFVDYVLDGNRKLPIGWRLDKLDELRSELGVFMVYRKKSEVLDLPPLITKDLELPMLPDQARIYNQVRDEFWALYEGGGIKAVNAMDHMNKLRQIATAWPGVGSSKLDFTVAEIESLDDYQFVVFTWYKTPGRLLLERLNRKHDIATLVDGDVKKADRRQRLLAHEKGKFRVLIGSIATIGESLNLQYVHEAVRLDRHWNPEVNKQTAQRIHRDGTQERVTLRDLWTPHTVDTLRVKPAVDSKTSMRKALFN